MFNYIAGLSVLISTLAFAGKPSCELALEHQDKVCAKTFRAQSIEDINSYLIDFKQKDGVPKNLKIDFDIAGSSLSIATPCRVILTDSKKIEVSGDVCINGQAGVIIRPYSTLSFRDMSLVSKNRVVIRNNSTINGSDLHLISSGDDEFSRSHIRHSSNINLSNLSVSGHARATLGHSSTYNVSGVVNLNSVSEFSAIWRDTNISAQSISINSDARIRLAKNLELNSSNIVLESNECSLSNNVLEGLGTCLTASFPIARLKKVESDIAIGSVINFDASRSVGASNFIFLIDGNIAQEGNSALFSYQFNQAGVHKVEVIAISSEGLRHRRSRKINVYIPFDNSPKANFVFVIGKGELPEVFLSFSGSVGKDRSIKSIKYLVDGVQFVPEDFFYFTFVRADLERSGIKEISMELVDDLDQKSVKSYQVDANPGQMNYIANLDVYQSAPKTVFVDASQSFVGNEELFDYFQNEIPVLIDFGDGNSSEALLPKAFSSHEYESAGTYNISAQMKSTNPDIESMIVSQNINITEDPTPILEPVARFNYLLNDFDKSYSFFVERSASAYGEIINYLWKVNGVIVASGSEVELILEPNIYEISLEVVDELGNMGSFSRVINVSGDASLFDLKLNCSPEEDNYLEYRCDLAFLDELKSVISLNLDWGDGNSSSIAISNQTYQQSSLYHTYADGLPELEVVATLARQNSDTLQRSQTLFEGNAPIDPVAVLNCSFDVNILNCDGSQSVAGPSQYIVNYWFNIGGDGISPNISVEYPMGSSESVYVQLWVVDNQGRVGYAEGYFTQDITKPIANFDCTALGAELNCSDSSINSNGVITNRLWFVNGQLASEGVDKTSFSFTANYPAEYYISLVVVNSLDQSDDLTKSYFLNVPVYPVADFSCNVVENTINCDGSSSSTPYGEITSYRWLVNGNEHSTASSMSYTHESGGSVSIGLEVANNFNFYNSKYEAFDIIVNQAPIVSFSCSDGIIQKINCINESVDPEGGILTYIWEVEGNSYTSENLDIDTISSGSIEVKLTANDGIDSSSLVQQVSVLSNSIPQINLVCNSNGPFKISCNSNAVDSDEGQELTHKWYLNDQLVSSAQNLETEYSNSLSVNVKVDVSDGIDAVSSNVSIELARPEITLSPSCYQTDNFIVKCSYQLPDSLSEVIDNSVWLIDSNEIGSSSEITYNVGEARTLSIELRASFYSGELNSSDLITFVVEEKELSEYPSSGILQLTNDLSYPININDEKNISISGAFFSLEENSIGINFNGNSLELSDFEISTSELKILKSSIEGKNEIEVFGVDDSGKRLSAYFEFIAGSKSIDLEIDSSGPINLTVFYLEDKNITYQYQIESNQTLNNLPDKDLVFVSESAEGFKVYRINQGQQLLLNIDFSDIALDEITENISFDTGLSGWKLVNGSSEIVTKQSDLVGFVGEGENSINLAPNINGEVHLRSKVIISEDLEGLTLPVNLNSSNEDAFVILSIKNITSGQKELILDRSIDLGSLKFNNDLFSYLGIDVKQNDELIVDIYSYFGSNSESTVFNELIKYVLPSSLYAQSEKQNRLTLSSIGRLRTLSNVYLLDNQGWDIGKQLSTMVTGKFPANYSQFSVNDESKKVYKVKLSGVSYKDSLKELRICPNNFDDILKCTKFESFSNEFEFPDNSIGSSNFFNIFLLIKNPITREIIAGAKVVTTEKQSNFIGIVNLSEVDESVSQVSEVSSKRYGSRKNGGSQGSLGLEDGSDEWIASSHVSLFKSLMSHEFQFVKGDDLKNIRIDDASPTGVNSLKGLGHSGQKYGKTADFRYALKNESYSGEWLQKNGDLPSSRIKGLNEAKALISLLNNENYGDKISRIITAFNENLDSDNYFYRELIHTCLDNGRYPLYSYNKKGENLIRNYVNHSNHFDLKFEDFSIDGEQLIHNPGRIDISNVLIELFPNSSVPELEDTFKVIIPNHVDGIEYKLFYKRVYFDRPLVRIELSEGVFEYKNDFEYISQWTQFSSGSESEMFSISDFSISSDNQAVFTIKFNTAGGLDSIIREAYSKFKDLEIEPTFDPDGPNIEVSENTLFSKYIKNYLSHKIKVLALQKKDSEGKVVNRCGSFVSNQMAEFKSPAPSQISVVGEQTVTIPEGGDNFTTKRYYITGTDYFGNSISAFEAKFQDVYFSSEIDTTNTSSITFTASDMYGSFTTSETNGATQDITIAGCYGENCCPSVKAYCKAEGSSQGVCNDPPPEGMQFLNSCSNTLYASISTASSATCANDGTRCNGKMECSLGTVFSSPAVGKLFSQYCSGLSSGDSCEVSYGGICRYRQVDGTILNVEASCSCSYSVP